MILIDNYDSFTYNIVQYLRELGVNPVVFENDRVNISELRKMEFESIIISPGAGNPHTAGISMQVIEEFYKEKKILGVCLGHQCIAKFFGADVVKANEPCHGKVSQIVHTKSQLFNGIPEKFDVTRYHSLVVENVSGCLSETAKTFDGINMAIEHKELPIFGVQFHPEAILSQYGHEIFKNFISI
uniref:anthranilate synthase component II n=1 Tax=Candidatus Scatousia sp. TaxID=3085663 RepID=UPI0040285C58